MHPSKSLPFAAQMNLESLNTKGKKSYIEKQILHNLIYVYFGFTSVIKAEYNGGCCGGETGALGSRRQTFSSKMRKV